MQHFLEVSQLREALGPEAGLGVLRPEEAVFRSMLGGWSNQQRSRGLVETTIEGRSSNIQHFFRYAGSYPWQWQASDLDEYSTWMRGQGLAISTMRQRHNTLALFCAFLTSPEYDWAEICESTFGEVPSQICHAWNTTRHFQDYEGRPGRRALSFDELQRFFDYADSRVESTLKLGRKGALAALRDAQLFKTAYVFGLRRAEVRGLDLQDFHFNAKVPQWGQYAALHVRFAKASRGGTPRRRTVLLVPEMEWWIEGMKQWIEQGRDLFGPAGSNALWPTERQSRVSLAYIDRRFQTIRRELDLDPALTLHCLRHSYVTHLIEYGYADRFVQEQVGHLHSSTTAIYTSVSGDFKNRVLADAIRKFNFLEEK